MPSVVHPDCDRDKDDEGGEGGQVREERLYYVQNWRHDVVALIHAPSSTQMKIVERIRYDAYGRPTSFNPADLARAGAVIGPDGDVDNNDDIVAVSGTGAQWYNDFGTGSSGTNYLPDGTKNGHDYTAFSDAMTDPSGHYGGGGPGILSGTNLDNRVGYAGYRFDRDLSAAGAAGANGKPVYHVRHRVLDSTSGKWLQMDPLGYVDGVSLYEYAASVPTRFIDPSGLDITDRIAAWISEHAGPWVNGGVIIDATVGPHVGAVGGGIGGYGELSIDLASGDHSTSYGPYSELAVGYVHGFYGEDISTATDGSTAWGGAGVGPGEVLGIGVGGDRHGPFVYAGVGVPLGIAHFGGAVYLQPTPHAVQSFALFMMRNANRFIGGGAVQRPIRRGNTQQPRITVPPSLQIPPVQVRPGCSWESSLWTTYPMSPMPGFDDMCGCQTQLAWNIIHCYSCASDGTSRQQCIDRAHSLATECWLRCIDEHFVGGVMPQAASSCIGASSATPCCSAGGAQ